MKKLAFLPLLALLAAGCTSITNLTPAQYQRNDTGLYRVGAQWQTRRTAVEAPTVAPSVQVGLKSYPMEKVANMDNRWETFVPVAADQNQITYRFKFDYIENRLPAARANSKLSDQFKLEILEKK